MEVSATEDFLASEDVTVLTTLIIVSVEIIIIVRSTRDLFFNVIFPKKSVYKYKYFSGNMLKIAVW